MSFHLKHIGGDDDLHGDRAVRAAATILAAVNRSGASMGGVRRALFRLPRVKRLALELALHESSEQHALDAELASLQRAWREAEEIAAISDDLLVPKHVQSTLDDAKKRTRS